MWCHGATFRTRGAASTLAWRFPYDDRSETLKGNRYPLALGPVREAQELLGPSSLKIGGYGLLWRRGASRGYGSRRIASRTVLVCRYEACRDARPTHSPRILQISLTVSNFGIEANDVSQMATRDRRLSIRPNATVSGHCVDTTIHQSTRMADLPTRLE